MSVAGTNERPPLMLEASPYAAFPIQLVHGLLVPPCFRCLHVQGLSIACAYPRQVWFIPSSAPPSAFSLLESSSLVDRSRTRFCGRDGSRCLFLLMTSSQKHSCCSHLRGFKNLRYLFFLLPGFPPCCRKKH